MEALDLRLLVLGHLGEQGLGEIVASTKSAGLVLVQGSTRVETSSPIGAESCPRFQDVS